MWLRSLPVIFHTLAGHCALIRSVQLVILAVVVVIPDIPAEGCFLLCGMAVNSSMSFTHRLIPRALSVLSLSQACMYTQCPTLLIHLSPFSYLPLPPFLPCLHLLFISPALPLLYLRCPPSPLLSDFHASKAVESSITKEESPTWQG